MLFMPNMCLRNKKNSKHLNLMKLIESSDWLTWQYMQVWTGINSYYLVQIYAILVWINTKLVWNHTIELWNLGFKSFPKNSVRNWMIKCETIFSISPLLAVLLIKRSENHFLSGPTRYEFILHWYEFIPGWYCFMLR